MFQSSEKTARPEEKIMLFHEVGFCETTASSHPNLAGEELRFLTKLLALLKAIYFPNDFAFSSVLLPGSSSKQGDSEF